MVFRLSVNNRLQWKRTERVSFRCRRFDKVSVWHVYIPMSKAAKRESLPISRGIGPPILVLYGLSSSSLTRFPISVGKEPSKGVLTGKNQVSHMISPGWRTHKYYLHKIKYTSDVASPISLGMEPPIVVSYTPKSVIAVKSLVFYAANQNG